MTDTPKKSLRDLADHMRADRDLLDRFAIHLATATPGDWQALIDRLQDQGYNITSEELRDAMISPKMERTDFLKSWA